MEVEHSMEIGRNMQSMALMAVLRTSWAFPASLGVMICVVMDGSYLISKLSNDGMVIGMYA